MITRIVYSISCFELVHINTNISDASKKAEIYTARYHALRQRTSRHKLFTPAVVGSTGSDMNSDTSGGSKKYQLKCVDFLLGTTSKLDNVIVLGMLTQIKHGKYSLEDPTGSVDLDMSEAKFHRGLYTENCFVLVEGNYDNPYYKHLLKIIADKSRIPYYKDVVYHYTMFKIQDGTRT